MKNNQSINEYLNSLDPLTYAAVEEQYFENNLHDYQKQTTFYGDLSIAERFGKDSIIETYDNVIESWGDDIVFMTEFCMALNYKSWEHNDRKNYVLVELYSTLYDNCVDFIYKNFTGDDIIYFYKITD